MMTRRSLLGFLAAAPFIVKASSLMPVRSFALDAPPLPPAGWFVISGIDQYGCQHSEAIRWLALKPGYDGAIRWQRVDHIVRVDGSFAR